MILSLITSIVLSETIFSFAEHQMHENFMHKKVLPRRFYQKPYMILQEIFEGHAVRHHGVWYRDFDFEANPEGKNDNIKFRLVDILIVLTCLLPIACLFFSFSLLAGVTFIVMLLIHAFLWNTMHSQMHLPQPVFFADWSIFRWLAVHHYMHHQFTNKNYNIVVPLADYILGTKIEPRRKDLRELLRLGYLKPRSPKTEIRLQKIRNKIATQREIAVQREAILVG
jgi:hypothetical protein